MGTTRRPLGLGARPVAQVPLGDTFMANHQIYLIPGFFGFANFGNIKYFAHVREMLTLAFAELGETAAIHYVTTLPTASLEKRAAAVAGAIAETSGLDTEPIHLVGHSTGGLDARLFNSPGVSLPGQVDTESLASRVQSIVAIATPHYGTPSAALFASTAGQEVLKVLSILTLHGLRIGTMPLPALMALTGALPRIGRLSGPLGGILEQVYGQLLRDFDDARRQELEDFLTATQGDQGLLSQLTPDAQVRFNRTTSLRPTTRHGSVVIQARAPSLKKAIGIGVSPSGQAVYALYRALHTMAATLPSRYIPALSPEQSTALIRAFGELPPGNANDAIVPTMSQPWETIVHAAWADHLDVVGHFSEPHHVPPHIDWLSTQTHFDRTAFERLWRDVARFLLNVDEESSLSPS